MSDTTEQKKVEVELPADLAKRFAEAKTPAEKNAILGEFAQARGANETKAAQFSDEQFRTLMSEMGKMAATEAKAAVTSVTTEVVRKYNLSADKAEEIAERSMKTAEARQMNQREDMQIAAEVIRGIYLARQGKPGQYQSAIEKEADHYKRKYGRQTRAMSLGTDSSGGYLAPTYFSDMLYEAIARSSLVRKFATIIPMQGNEVINIPTMTAGLSASQTSEASTTSGVQPTFSQKQLTTKKIVTKTRPVSVEMIEKANPAIVQLLLQHAQIEILKKEDSLVFGTSGNGIRASSTNLVATGTAADGYYSISYDEMISLESGLDAQYLIGDDIQGSGIITGAPQYWLPHALKQVLKGKKDGTGRYLDETRELRNENKIFGHGCQRVLSLPDGSSLASTDKVAVFGNLAHVWCGVEPGFRIAIADQGATDNGGSEVNLFDTAQVALRVLEFFDSVVVDEEAFTIAHMA